MHTIRIRTSWLEMQTMIQLLFSNCITGSIVLSSNYYRYSRPVNIDDLNCTGNEEAVQNCPYAAPKRRNCINAALICQSNNFFRIIALWLYSTNDKCQNRITSIFVFPLLYTALPVARK